MYIMVPTIPAFSNKVYTLILSCVMFAFIYMLLDDSNFSGINIIQDDIRSELIKKEVKKEVPEDLGDDAAPANKVENFSGVVWEEITSTITEDEIKEQEKSAAIKEKTEDVKKTIKDQELAPGKITPGFGQQFFDRFYFSISTGCLMGYGDIYPTSNIAKVICMIQSTFTLALIVA